VITDATEGSYVEITGPKALNGVKRRKCNISHIEPTSDILKIKAKASDEDVLKAVESAKLSDKMKAGLNL
ncbi:MAG: 50S ribosomal protein L14e, partial [Candidatus Aenigmarchaeota archaeon]|nr:50S ribosomal protein L14e [Candidatus Aenigmarchaeota archaeon]